MYNPPSDSLTRQYFVLPSFNITARQCTPSPFTNASVPPTARQPYIYWSAPLPASIPAQCGDDLTQTIVQVLGAGPYTADAGNSWAQLILDADNVTASCVHQWLRTGSGVTTINVTITVRDGPIYSDDDILESNNPASPGWQSASFAPLPGVSVRLDNALPASARNFTRVIGCTVEGLTQPRTCPST